MWVYCPPPLLELVVARPGQAAAPEPAAVGPRPRPRERQLRNLADDSLAKVVIYFFNY